MVRRRRIRNVKGKRSRRRRRTSWYNRKYSVKQIAFKALKTARYLKGLINVEFKHHDVNTVFASVVNVWASDALTDIPQGDTDESRDGDAIRLKSLFMNITMQNVDANASQLLRFLIVQDNSDMENTAPLIADLIDGGDVSVQAMREIDLSNAKLYNIVHDKVYQLAQNGQPGSLKYLQLYFPLNAVVKWTSGTATDFKTGHFFLFVISSTTTASEVSLSFRARFRYIDN